MHNEYNLSNILYSFSGTFTETNNVQKIGAITKTHNCITLPDSGKYISFSCPGTFQDNIWILELDELHNKKGESFSYIVEINGKPAYVRTMEPMSSSICPFFLKLKLNQGDLITIRNNSNAPIVFQGLYLHNDIEAIKSTYLETMEIGLCFPRFTYTNRKSDLALMKKIAKDFSDLKHFTVALGIEIKYMQANNEKLVEQFEYILGLAEEAKVNLIFNFNTWWDGTPNGRDGKGGYFNDVEYQQIVYDPLREKTFLSIPNLWKNTPWYTMNHEHLNYVRKIRLESTLELLGRTAAKLKVNKEYFPSYRILIDNEPAYWSEFAYCASPECGGDFNEHTIAAAKKDGVDLTPKGYPTHEQKEWLIHNLSTYMNDISKTYHASSTKEYAVVENETVHYENHYLTENIFTHAMTYSGHPYADNHHMRYEEHVNPYTRLGIETCGHQDERLLSYCNGTGRFAQVNAERCCYTNPIFHHQIYAHGAVCDIIFNFFYDTDIKHLHDLDQLDALFLPNPYYGTPVMAYHSYDNHAVGGKIVEINNIETAPLRERRVLRPTTLGRGHITFSIGQVKDFPHGGWVELIGLVRPESGSITASIGSTTETLDYSLNLPERDADYQEIPFEISLNDVLAHYIDVPEQELYLRLDFETLFYDDWAQMNSIWEIRSLAAFPEIAAPCNLPLTLEESRALSLMVSYRTDCQRLRSTYPSINIETAHCNHKELYQEIMHAISLQNTDKFYIHGNGYLEKYRLYVDSGDSKVILHLHQTKEGFLVKLWGDNGQIAFLMDGFMLKAKTVSPNCYLLTIHEATQKAVYLCLSVTEIEKENFQLNGTFLNYDSDNKRIEIITHNSKDWEYQESLFFDCDPNVPVSLKASEIAGNLLEHISTNPYTPAAILDARIDSQSTIQSLRKGDSLTLNINGSYIESIHAIRGIARGKITHIEPMSLVPPMHNAFLTIETAPSTYITFELGMQTHLNYTRAHAENPLLAGELDLELTKDCIVLITFEAEKYGERPYRALEITIV